jgi:H/ACA ribonucleoprotein complex subunit 2
LVSRIVILAADVSPMDVISHIPVLCEENDVPYAFVSSKEEIGAAGSTKRPASVILVSSKSEGSAKESYDSCVKEMKSLSYVK